MKSQSASSFEVLSAELAQVKTAVSTQKGTIQDIVNEKRLAEMPHAQQELQKLARALNSLTRRIKVAQA